MQSIFLVLRLSLWLFALFAAVDCEAQKILVLDRDGHVKRIRFRVHDDIEVRTASNPYSQYGEITAISDSTITIADSVIVVSKITTIRFERQASGTGLLRQASVTLPAAAVVLLAFDAITYAINKPHAPVYAESTLITAGALVVAGPIAYIFTFHKYKINKHHRLKVIDVSIN